ncbi:MAG: hypothetical protein LBT24_00775 [Tannerella sp.]|jgi:hypothetical protein|nr:hypothetical protein [Tannerella sp.]
MATFNYTVDTNPMAAEIGSVSRQVNATTTAVVAMQTAVVLAEEKAADHVCANVNKGFYSLIRSQISQKIAKFQSEVDSHLMQLTQQRKALLAIKNRMERDYNMISGRYLKLFNGLNANLKQRVFELDKPTVDFAVREVDKISNRTKYLTATVPVSQLESLTASQKIIASKVKLRGLNVINSMKSFLFEMNIQKKLTDRILINDGKYTETASVFIPVIISECNHDNSDNKQIEITVPQTELDSYCQSAIRNAVHNEMPQIKWLQEETLNQEVKSEFSKLISTSSCSQRAKELATRLFMTNNYQTI